jgi:hypothetical protein
VRHHSFRGYHHLAVYRVDSNIPKEGSVRMGDNIRSTNLEVKPNAPQGGVGMPHCEFESEALSDKEFEVEDVGGGSVGNA